MQAQAASQNVQRDGGPEKHGPRLAKALGSPHDVAGCIDEDTPGADPPYGEIRCRVACVDEAVGKKFTQSQRFCFAFHVARAVRRNDLADERKMGCNRFRNPPIGSACEYDLSTGLELRLNIVEE